MDDLNISNLRMYIYILGLTTPMFICGCGNSNDIVASPGNDRNHYCESLPSEPRGFEAICDVNSPVKVGESVLVHIALKNYSVFDDMVPLFSGYVFCLVQKEGSSDWLNLDGEIVTDEGRHDLNSCGNIEYKAGQTRQFDRLISGSSALAKPGKYSLKILVPIFSEKTRQKYLVVRNDLLVTDR